MFRGPLRDRSNARLEKREPPRSTAGARGVGEEANMDTAAPNYAAVAEVEKIAVSSSEVDAFAKTGGLK